MKKSLLVLLCISGHVFAQSDLVTRSEIWKTPAPVGWESSVNEGDINGDGKNDFIVWIHQPSSASIKNNNLVVFLQSGNNSYKEVFRSERTVSDSSSTYRIIYPLTFNGRLAIFAEKVDSNDSERFTFGFRNGHFVLVEFASFNGQNCNKEMAAPYRWTDRVEPIPLENFSVEYFHKEHLISAKAHLKKDIDYALEEQYQGLLTSFKSGDKNSLSEAVIRDIVGFDEKGKRCVPDDYMERYLFLDDADKVGVSNDIAFFLEQTGYNDEAIWLLTQIVSSYPNRTVAYLNLGDAYWGKGNKNEAKNAYRKYIELMKISSKARRIPKEVTIRMAQ